MLSDPARLPTARLSVTARRVLFTSPGYRHHVDPVGGGAAEKLCEHCGEVMGTSSDGRRALYEPLENEDVVMHDADTHATVTLAKRPDKGVILSSAQFSQDGKWVAFHALRNATNSAQIWIVPVGPERPVPQTAWIAVTGGDALERDPAWSARRPIPVLHLGARRLQVRVGALARSGDETPDWRRLRGPPLPFGALSLRHVGSRGSSTGLTVGDGALVFAMGELKRQRLARDEWPLSRGTRHDQRRRHQPQRRARARTNGGKLRRHPAGRCRNHRHRRRVDRRVSGSRDAAARPESGCSGWRTIGVARARNLRRPAGARRRHRVR